MEAYVIRVGDLSLFRCLGLIGDVLYLSRYGTGLIDFGRYFKRRFKVGSVNVFNSITHRRGERSDSLSVIMSVSGPALSAVCALGAILARVFRYRVSLIHFHSSLPPFLGRGVRGRTVCMWEEAAGRLQRIGPSGEVRLLCATVRWEGGLY